MSFNNFLRIGFVFFHSILLLILSYFVQSVQLTYGDEKLIADGLEKIEHNWLHVNDEADSNRFIFLNTSKSKMLLPAFDKETGFIEIGNECITDRSQIIALLESLDSTQFEYLILDVFMDRFTEFDQKLEQSLFELGNNIVPYHLSDNDTPIYPIINANRGLADIHTIGDVLYKYRIIEKGYKSIPLRIYEDLNNTELEEDLLFYHLENHIILNDFVMNFRIRNYHIFEQSQKWNYMELGEFLLLPDEFIAQKVKNRIIVVGDFESDQTDSITGSISGPLVLLNAFLAIENGEVFISFYFIIYLFIAFCLLTIIAFDPYDFLDYRFENPKFLILKLIKSKAIRIVLFTALISIVSYLLFGKFISIFFIALYIIIIDKVVNLARKSN